MPALRFVVLVAAATVASAAPSVWASSCQDAFAAHIDRSGGLSEIDPDTLEKLCLEYLECRYDEDPFP